MKHMPTCMHICIRSGLPRDDPSQLGTRHLPSQLQHSAIYSTACSHGANSYNGGASAACNGRTLMIIRARSGVIRPAGLQVWPCRACACFLNIILPEKIGRTLLNILPSTTWREKRGWVGGSKRVREQVFLPGTGWPLLLPVLHRS
jgi:hypothetical protein